MNDISIKYDGRFIVCEDSPVETQRWLVIVEKTTYICRSLNAAAKLAAAFAEEDILGLANEE